MKLISVILFSILFQTKSLAGIIQIEFDGLSSGSDQLNIFGLDESFSNILTKGVIQIDLDKLPSSELTTSPNYQRAEYLNSESDWLSITYEINGVLLSNNHMFETKTNYMSLGDTSDSAIGEHFFLRQGSEYESEGRDLISGMRQSISSSFQLRSDDGENLINGIDVPSSLPTYDSFNISFSKAFSESDGSMTGLQSASHFSFTTLNNIEWKSISATVPEPSTLAIFGLGLIGLFFRKFQK